MPVRIWTPVSWAPLGGDRAGQCDEPQLNGGMAYKPFLQTRFWCPGVHVNSSRVPLLLQSHCSTFVLLTALSGESELPERRSVSTNIASSRNAKICLNKSNQWQNKCNTLPVQVQWKVSQFSVVMLHVGDDFWCLQLPTYMLSMNLSCTQFTIHDYKC